MQRYQKEWTLLIAAAVLLGVSAWVWLRRTKSPKPILLRMTAGDAIGIRHRIASEFAKEAQASGLRIEVVASEGSEKAISRLNVGEFELALVQGGIENKSISNTRQISPLHIEPLHFLVKPEVAPKVLEKGIRQLIGHSINRGTKGSGTYMLASEVLSFAGVGLDADVGKESSDFVPNNQSYSELMQSSYDQLPDAIFTVSTMPSPIADLMIERHGFQLVPLNFGEAFSIEAMSDLGTDNKRTSINRQHVFATSIPQFTYSLDRKVPAVSLETLGTRLLLVGHESVPGETVKQLLEVLYRSKIAKADRPVIDASLLDLPAEYPMHVGAQLYRQRNKPLIAGDAIDYLEKVLAIGATLFGGAFFTLQWYRQTVRRKREASFASYMERVIAIEQESMQNELSAHLDLASLIRLQQELSNLKAEAVTRFANGKLQGEGLIQGFLALVNDAREQLTRLILHQRENIEQLAAEKHSNPDQIWREQSRGSSANSSPFS